MTKSSRVLAVALAALLAGCGVAPQGTVRPSSAPTLRAQDDHDVTHAKLNAIVQTVLAEQLPYLLEHADADRNGAISRAEYGLDRDAAVVALFMTRFDANHDGQVAAGEYRQALTATDSVEAYHHVVEERMSQAVAPYVQDQDFDFTELRDYMTHGLGLTADWPLLARIFAELDLNQDEKLLSGKGEGPAFLLKFARPQLQRALALPPDAAR